MARSMRLYASKRDTIRKYPSSRGLTAAKRATSTGGWTTLASRS